MKRAGGLYMKIPERENLIRAFFKAAKGKRRKNEVMAFQADFDNQIRKLQHGIFNCNPDIGNYKYFQVFDPKPRNICAAAFPEQVLHHAVMNVCEPVLEAYAVFDSYACRKGKGQHKAIHRAQAFSNKYEWYLKLDVKKYFDSIDHMIALKLLCRRFKDKDLIILFARMLDAYHTQLGKGVPIGNLISQHLANFYLGGFDHYIKEVCRVKAYLRYMDDLLLFGRTKAELKFLTDEIRWHLKAELELELKENIQLNRSRHGIPFLGFRIYPHAIRLSPRSKRRFVRKFIDFEKKWAEGVWDENELVRHMEPLFAFAQTADSLNFRRNVIQRFGAPF